MPNYSAKCGDNLFLLRRNSGQRDRACSMPVAATGAFFSETETFDWRVIGLDVAPGMCKVARQHLVPVINSSVEAIPLGENIFDGVFFVVDVAMAG